MSTELIAAAFNHLISRFDVSSFEVGDERRLDEYVKENSGDRRFSVKITAGVIRGDGLYGGAYLTYRGHEYYVEYDHTTGQYHAVYA